MTKLFKKINNRGITILPIVMVLGIIALAVAVGILAVSFNESLTSQGLSQSSRALFNAEAGARDALTRIARNKNYVCSSTDCYSLDITANGCSLLSDCAKISVSAGLGTTGDPKIIVSKGIVKSSTRRMQVSVVLDGGTTDPTVQFGVVTSAVWTELTN